MRFGVDVDHVFEVLKLLGTLPNGERVADGRYWNMAHERAHELVGAPQTAALNVPASCRPDGGRIDGVVHDQAVRQGIISILSRCLRVRERYEAPVDGIVSQKPLHCSWTAHGMSIQEHTIFDQRSEQTRSDRRRMCFYTYSRSFSSVRVSRTLCSPIRNSCMIRLRCCRWSAVGMKARTKNADRCTYTGDGRRVVG